MFNRSVLFKIISSFFRRSQWFCEHTVNINQPAQYCWKIKIIFREVRKLIYCSLIWRSFQSFRKYIFSPFYTFLKQLSYFLSFSLIVCIVPEFSDDDRVSLLDKTPIGYLDWCYVMVYIDTFIRGNRKESTCIRKKIRLL